MSVSEQQLKPQKKHVDFDLADFEGDERAAMAKMYEDTLKQFTEGSIVQGKILEIRKSDILIDTKYER